MLHGWILEFGPCYQGIWNEGAMNILKKTWLLAIKENLGHEAKRKDRE